MREAMSTGKNLRKRIATLNPKPSANGHATPNGQSLIGPSTAVSDGETNGKPEAKQKPPETPAANTGRTANGRFTLGNLYSKGNPFARRLGALRSAFLNAVTDADVTAVARKLAELAAAGDVQAAALFLSYAVGKPLSAVNPDALDLNEFALLDAAPTASRVCANLLDTVDPAAAVKMLRLILTTHSDADKVHKHVFKSSKMRTLEETQARVGKKAN